MTSEWECVEIEVGLAEAVGHSVCALEALARPSGKRFIMLGESTVSYGLLLSLGWRMLLLPPPTDLAYIIPFSACVQVQKVLLSCFLETPQACKSAHTPLPWVVGDLWEALTGGPFPSESIYGESRSSQGQGRRNLEPRSMTRTRTIKHLASSDPAQASLLTKI